MAYVRVATYHQAQRDERKEKRRLERKETRQKFYDAALERIRGTPNADPSSEPSGTTLLAEENGAPQPDAPSVAPSLPQNGEDQPGAKKMEAMKGKLRSFLRKEERTPAEEKADPSPLPK